jgi:hypothetical protein
MGETCLLGVYWRLLAEKGRELGKKAVISHELCCTNF